MDSRNGNKGASASRPGSRASTEPEGMLGPSGFDPSRIWRYARSQKKALASLLPEDFQMTITGCGMSEINVSGTIKTTMECDALITALLQFRRFLTSHREAVAGDIFDAPPPGPSFADEWKAAFGPMHTPDEIAVLRQRLVDGARRARKELARRDSDGSGAAGETALAGSTEGDSAGPEGIAHE